MSFLNFGSDKERGASAQSAPPTSQKPPVQAAILNGNNPSPSPITQWRDGIVQIGGENHFSILKPDGKPFLFGEKKMLIGDLDGNEGEVLAIENMDPLRTPLRVKLANQDIETVFFREGRFLVLASEESPHEAYLMDQQGKRTPKHFRYPLEFFEDPAGRKQVVASRNDDFIEAYSPSDNAFSFYRKSGEAISPVTIDGSPFPKNSEYDAFPRKDRAWLVGTKLVVWHEKEGEFRMVKKGGVEFNSVQITERRSFGDHVYINNHPRSRQTFCLSRTDPHSPEIIQINGHAIFCEHPIPHPDGKKSDNRLIISELKHLGIAISITPEDIIEIEGMQFLPVGNDHFFDGKTMHRFSTDADGKIRTIRYAGKECPVFKAERLSISESFDQVRCQGKMILSIQDKKLHETILVMERVEDEGEGEGSLADGERYQKISLLAGTEDRNLAGISEKHRVVAYAGTPESFDYYSIRNDGTLKKSISGAFEMEISDSSMHIFLPEKEKHRNNPGEGEERRGTWYELIRRSGSFSALDPLLLEGEQYLVARKKDPDTLLLLKICAGDALKEMDIRVDGATFMPECMTRSHGTTFHHDRQGAIIVGGKCRQLIDFTGARTKDLSSSILDLAGVPVMVFRSRKGRLLGYAIEHGGVPMSVEYVDISPDGVSISDTRPKEIRMAELDGVKHFLIREFKDQGVLLLKGGSEKDGLSLRYVCNVSKDGIEAKEFCDAQGETVRIRTFINFHILIDKDGGYLYRKDRSNVLHSLEIPEGMFVSEKEDDGVAVEHLGLRFGIKPKNGLPTPLSWDKGQYYPLADDSSDCRINGKDCKMRSLWNDSEKRVESFMQSAEGMRALKFGNCVAILVRGRIIFPPDDIERSLPAKEDEDLIEPSFESCPSIWVGDDFDYIPMSLQQDGFYIATPEDQQSNGFKEITKVRISHTGSKWSVLSIERAVCAVYSRDHSRVAVEMKLKGLRMEFRGGEVFSGSIRYPDPLLERIYAKHLPDSFAGVIASGIKEKVASQMGS